jgi:hypothetical protein
LAARHNGVIALTRRKGFRISRADRANFLVLPRPAGAQRRKTRETDLSAEQIGAQTAAWLPLAHGDKGRPQSAR